MKTNKEGENIIKHFEGLHDGDLKQIGLQPKLCPADIWTEGWGRTMRDKNGKFLKGIENKSIAFKNATIKTKEQADEALSSDLKIYEDIVNRKIKVSINENQFSALVSYVYNTGGSSTLYNLINKKASDRDIRNWIENHYIIGGGKILKGLVLRRKAESNLYFKP